MKYAGILIIISTLLLSLSLPYFEVVKKVYYTETVEVASKNDALYTLPQTNPLPGYAINSKYGMRKHPVDNVYKLHAGCDQACPVGTEIQAQGNGKVTRVEYKKGGYGTNITISHGLDADENVVTVRYAHLSKVFVETGQFVKQGDIVALTGNTGKSTGPHLHYEYRLNGVAQNPENHIDYQKESVSIHNKADGKQQMFEDGYCELYQLSADDSIATSSRMWGKYSD